MKAVIVAAGQSSRMYPLTQDTPKPLLKVGERSLLKRSCLNLQEHGITKIGVVIGYLKEQFYKVLDKQVTFIENPFYAYTNNMASLWCAKDFVQDEEFMYLHGDLVYHPDILRSCLDQAGDIVLAVDQKVCDEEDMKVKIKDDLLVESSKNIPLEEAYGEWTGIAKFTVKGSSMMFEEIGEVLDEGQFEVYDTFALTRLAQKGKKVNVSHTNAQFWMEVDFIEELEKAREMNQ